MASKGTSKFNVSKDASKRTYDGIVFDSVLEMRFYKEVLLSKLESGEVVRYELQKKYELQLNLHNGKKIRQSTMWLIFLWFQADGHEEVIDTKGCPDSVALIKRKMFWFTYPDVDYKWICYSKIDGGWCDYEYVKKQRAIRRKEK